MLKPDSINEILISTQQENQDQLLHYGVLGMKWGKRKKQYGSSPAVAKNPKTGGILRRFRKKDPQGQNANQILDPRRKRNVSKVDSRLREDQFIYEYEHRDRMSTKAIKARNERIKAEREFESLVYAPQRERQKAERVKKERRKKLIKTAAVVGINGAANYGLENIFYRNGVKPEQYGIKYDKDANAYTGNINNIKRYRKDKEVFDSLKSTNEVVKNMSKMYADFSRQLNGNNK